MLFLLTTVERSPEQRIRDRHLLKSREGADGTDESINAGEFYISFKSTQFVLAPLVKICIINLSLL